MCIVFLFVGLLRNKRGCNHFQISVLCCSAKIWNNLNILLHVDFTWCIIIKMRERETIWKWRCIIALPRIIFSLIIEVWWVCVYHDQFWQTDIETHKIHWLQIIPRGWFFNTSNTRPRWFCPRDVDDWAVFPHLLCREQIKN